jgi:hypothetical protein
MLPHRDIDDRGDSENCFARQQRHQEEQTRMREDCSPTGPITYKSRGA